ncbi:MAG: glucose-1-phosphate adenylyltransferase [Chloroflexota bacterium]|nr:glucose-1-phosphate adenylyltransferase [Chloroflexota bacterium]
MSSLNNTLSVIMGGGRGTRLYPLTRVRAKPAVPIAGKYRLIDIPISNCINSGINRIALLTQFNSVSLHRHITGTYNFDSFHRGWVQIWAAEQTVTNDTWYQGTADAVRQQLLEIRASGAKNILILAGDHLYRMDYAEMVRFHWENDADITVAVQPIASEQATRFGLLKRDADYLISDFVEKPKDPKVQARFTSRDDPKRPYLGSMGIYLFNLDVLINVLVNTKDDDFGGEVIPRAIHTHRVYGFDFDDYWEDVGTIRSFYDTNLSLAQPNPPFEFNAPNSPIYSRPRFLPGTVVNGASLKNVLLADGCIIGEAQIQNSVIGLRSQIKDGVIIKNTVLMGADYFGLPHRYRKEGFSLGIGANTRIDGALIDKNARIGEGVIIKPFPLGTELKLDYCSVRDGIVVIPKSTAIPPGTVIGPE